MKNLQIRFPSPGLMPVKAATYRALAKLDAGFEKVLYGPGNLRTLADHIHHHRQHGPSSGDSCKADSGPALAKFEAMDG